MPQGQPHPGLDVRIPSDRHKTLEERRAARIAERRLTRKIKDYPPGERKDRHRAMVFFATLPTDILIAAHKGTLQLLEQRKQTTP